MPAFDAKKHWETIYETKALTDVSWYQLRPETSLQFIDRLEIKKSAKIIDVGGGDSFFVDHLLELGFSDITVLDISSNAIDRAKKRLGTQADLVKWIVADAANFDAPEHYDFWHDRAAFHFLTSQEDVANYVRTAAKNIVPSGHLIMGTFSKEGPLKCSGIEIQQYSEETLSAQFSTHFERIESFTTDHSTPFNTTQNFVFCSFRRNLKA